MATPENTAYLGTERIYKLVVKFGVPCVLSLLVSALYNVVDQIFIGNSELSTLGNAATGVVFPLFIIAQAFAWWIGDGCAAYINIHQGRGDTEHIHECVGTSVVATLAISLLAVVVFYPIKTTFLVLFGASEDSLPYAEQYYEIILFFLPVYMLSNMINSVIRADGSPAVSMASMLAGAIINIILDPVFIFGFRFGMAGAAWATAIGQSASLAVSLAYLPFSKTFRLSLTSFIPRIKDFSEATRLGLSSLVTQLAIVILALTSNAMFAKYGGTSHYGKDIPMAAIAIESKAFTVIISIVVGVALGCQPVISYNVGAKNFTRVKKLYKAIFLFSLAVGIISTLVFELFPDVVVELFGKPTNIPNPDDYYEFAKKTFRIFLSLVTFTCLAKASSLFFLAAGKSLFAAIVSPVRDLLCFVSLAIILPVFLGIDGVLIASPISDVVAIIVTAILTAVYFKNLEKQ